MSDEFEDLLKRWLRQRGATDRSTLQALAGNVAALPPRPRRRQPSNLAAAAAVIVALGLAAFALAPHNGSVSNQVNGPVASGPAAFAGDPRMAACSTDVADVDRVFEMVQSRYFPLYFPGWWRGAPELEVDDPALVVIGREQVWPITGAAPASGQTADPNAGLGYQMCIAVGGPASFIVHDYGVTHFDRIVPVLSTDDLVRAQHMDPDVLADPANYPVPARLAACGGITDQVQYVFEARSIDDYPRHFPAAAPLGLITAEEPATIVVYRGRNPSTREGPIRPSLGPNEHDLCILLGPDPGTAQPVFINGVDLTGFHVRIDEPASTETPAAKTAPSSTPAPGGPEFPNPAAFVGNPWFDLCGGPSNALTAFVVPRVRDLPLFIPAMLKSPEIQRDEPAFVLVYNGRSPFLRRGGGYVPGRSPGPEPTLAPNHDDICLIVGPVTGAGSLTIFEAVSLDGFNPNPPGAASPPPPTTDAPPFPVWPGIAWTDKNGAPADPLVLAAFSGPKPCGWDKAAFLEIGWPFGLPALSIDKVRRYVRDPSRIFNEPGMIILDRLDLTAKLPADAVFSGFRSGTIELWTSASTIDRAVFLRWPDHVERWPRMKNVVSCG